MTRRHLAFRRIVIAGLLAFTLGSVAAPTVVAAADEPNGNASCVGLELASISPPGSSDEEPGGAPQAVSEIKELASTFGLRPGALFSFIAHLHAGSHAECDEALE
jgi:hypothetical protein